ncbi:MAG: hypothetical protein WCX82_03965 [archaeon]|jgi:hypothetical protein
MNKKLLVLGIIFSIFILGLFMSNINLDKNSNVSSTKYLNSVIEQPILELGCGRCSTTFIKTSSGGMIAVMLK